MKEPTALPFHSFSFTLVEDRRPRAALRMTAIGELGRVQKNLYDIRIELGEQTNL